MGGTVMNMKMGRGGSSGRLARLKRSPTSQSKIFEQLSNGEVKAESADLSARAKGMRALRSIVSLGLLGASKEAHSLDAPHFRCGESVRFTTTAHELKPGDVLVVLVGAVRLPGRKLLEAPAIYRATAGALATLAPGTTAGWVGAEAASQLAALQVLQLQFAARARVHRERRGGAQTRSQNMGRRMKMVESEAEARALATTKPPLREKAAGSASKKYTVKVAPASGAGSG